MTSRKDLLKRADGSYPNGGTELESGVYYYGDADGLTTFGANDSSTFFTNLEIQGYDHH